MSTRLGAMARAAANALDRQEREWTPEDGERWARRKAEKEREANEVHETLVEFIAALKSGEAGAQEGYMRRYVERECGAEKLKAIDRARES